MSKEVAQTSSKLPDFMKKYQGEGQSDIASEDIKMPRLKIGQAMSPEVKDKKAEEGDLIHNITGQVICKAGEQLKVIPVAYSKEYILWYDRNGPKKGGIAARAKRVDEKGVIRYKWDKPNTKIEDKLDNKLPVEYNTKEYIDQDGLGDWGSQIPGDAESKPAASTHYNYVFMLPDHGNEMIAFSMSKTAAKKAQELNTMLKMGGAPIYGRVFNLSTFIDQAGEDKFANIHFDPAGLVSDEKMFMDLRSLYHNLKDKQIDVDFSDEENHSEAKGKNEAF